MADKRRPIRELKVGDRVAFPWRDPKFGRADFQVCVRWQRGKPLEAWVDPLNVPELQETLHVRIHDRYFIFSAWSHQGLQAEPPWLNFWCQEHNCPSFRAYAPPGATALCYHHDGDFRFERETQKNKPADTAEAEPAG